MKHPYFLNIKFTSFPISIYVTLFVSYIFPPSLHLWVCVSLSLCLFLSLCPSLSLSFSVPLCLTLTHKDIDTDILALSTESHGPFFSFFFFMTSLKSIYEDLSPVPIHLTTSIPLPYFAAFRDRGLQWAYLPIPGEKSFNYYDFNMWKLLGTVSN